MGYHEVTEKKIYQICTISVLLKLNRLVYVLLSGTGEEIRWVFDDI